MFATRLNQENDVYQQQTAAASKPLNQGVKGLAPKTPGNKGAKSPFKVSLNDENATQKLGKAGKAGKVQPEAFVTPAGPRTRAPLGNKTANTKATAFRTQAPPSAAKPSATKPTSPRLKRSKIQVHQPEPEVATGDDDDDVPEIEYMAPRGVPLPDHPDDWPLDRQYPQFEGANLTRGWLKAFSRPVDSDEDSLGDMDEFREELRKARARERAAEETEQRASRAASTTMPSTVKSRDAASALSSGAKKSYAPSFAAPTAAAKAKLTTRQPPGNPRHTAARAASNSTLGYTKGRVISSVARNPSATLPKTPSAPPPALEQLFGDTLHVSDDEGDQALGGGALATILDDELEDFQLQPMYHDV